MEKKSKNSNLFWVFFIIAVAAVIIIVWFISFRESTVIEEAQEESVFNDLKEEMLEEQEEVDELSDWNTYESADYGYSFKYPTGWDIDSSDSSSVVVSKYYTNDKGFEDGGTFVVDVHQNTENYTLAEWIDVNDSIDNETMDLISTEEKILAGVMGTYRVATSGISGGYMNSLTVLHDGYIYRIGLNTRILTEAVDTQAEFDDLLDKMLQSFEFGGVEF